MVASTALAASGAHIVLFTTGRGTPFACPVPTMKISTNSSLNNRKQNWIDFNCGTLVEGDTLPELAEKLFDEVIAVASGKEVKSEIAGFHDILKVVTLGKLKNCVEIIIWIDTSAYRRDDTF